MQFVQRRNRSEIWASWVVCEPQRIFYALETRARTGNLLVFGDLADPHGVNATGLARESFLSPSLHFSDPLLTSRV
jgi:hypothetical protein